MRNPDNVKPWSTVRNPRAARLGLLTSLAALAVAAAGCGPDKLAADFEKAARTADAAPDPAITAADRYLAKHPTGPLAARAWYVKGRGYESRTSRSAAESQANLRQATDAYERALALKPTGQFEALTRAGLANAAYFQDDYGTALREWTTAYTQLQDPDTRAWTLYRIGLSQQRLGRFDQADKTFVRVQSEYPGTTPAARAAEKRGFRQFFVQIGVYDKDAFARAALDAARKAGVPGAQLARDSQGRDILRAGPAGNYADAKALKQRIAPRYPNTMIVP
jgi:outer membrane protein assembly factor BamD (BamD/ComL family)